jgi:hypothetical protein
MIMLEGFIRQKIARKPFSVSCRYLNFSPSCIAFILVPLEDIRVHKSPQAQEDR